MSWFNLLKAPRPYRDDPKAKRTKRKIPYKTIDELDEVEREQADRGLGIQADKDARVRMKDPSLQSRIDMEIRSKGKRAGKKEALRRLTEEERADLDEKAKTRAFMGRGRKPGLYGRSQGYDIDSDEGVSEYERGYTRAERFERFNPVQLSKKMKKIIRNVDKKTDMETEIKQLFSEYLDEGAKFEPVHLTILNKAGLGMTELVDTVRDNMARKG